MSLAKVELKELPTRDLYKLLWAYYEANGLYEYLREESIAAGAEVENLRGLRNPANRVVEFYAAKLWPGGLDEALPIVADNQKIVPAIQQVWQWSNWAARKQRVARWFGCLGEMFLKVALASTAQHVFFQALDPAWVSGFDIDERGYLTWLRMDYTAGRRKPDGTLENYNHTEVWDKGSQLYRTWEHKRDLDISLNQLGTPQTTKGFGEFGIDFIPIVYAPLRDVGDQTGTARGVGAFTHALDKIDEANRQATTLHARLYRYNRPDKALVGVGQDQMGRPLPPPTIDSSGGTYEINGELFYQLPSGWKVENLVPALAWEAALKILQDHILELEKDLPELVYWRIQEASDLSGKAIRMMLSGAIDRALEARGNAEAALVRADQMALTIGTNAGLFKGLGAYETGAFDHAFKPRDIVPLTEQERAETAKAYVEATVPLSTALRKAGWSETALEEMAKDKEAESQREQVTLGQAMAEAQRRFDQGRQGQADGSQDVQGAAQSNPATSQ